MLLLGCVGTGAFLLTNLWLVGGFCVSRIYLMTDPAGAGIYANIGGI